MAMGLFAFAWSYIETLIRYSLSKLGVNIKVPDASKEHLEPPKIVFYLGILFGFTFWVWFLFFFALPLWDCYWNNICLS